MNIELWIRELLYEIGEFSVSHISQEMNLIEAGLDSLTMMRLLERFNQNCFSSISYVQLAEQPTISSWIRLVESNCAAYSANT